MAYGKLLFAPLYVTIVVALAYMHTKIIRCAANVAAKISDTNKEEGEIYQVPSKSCKIRSYCTDSNVGIVQPFIMLPHLCPI